MRLSEVLCMAKYDGWEVGYRDGMKAARRKMSKDIPRVTPGYKDGMELSQADYEALQDEMARLRGALEKIQGLDIELLKSDAPYYDIDALQLFENRVSDIVSIALANTV